MTTTKIDSVRLKAHAHQNISLVLDTLNISYSQRGPLYQAKCPIKDHPGNGDNNTAFSWKESVNSWVCWSHACDEKWGNDIYGLIRGVLGLDFKSSVKFLYDTLSKRTINLNQDVIIKPNPKKISFNKPISEATLKYLEPNYNYPFDKSLLKRGYDVNILKKYEVGFWHQIGSFMNDRMIFPIRDHAGFLVGFTGRTIYPKEQWAKKNINQKWLHGRYFNHFPKKDVSEFATSMVLYNFYNAKKHIGDSKTIILVEGPLDVLKLEQSGIHNSCAVLGVSNFSNSHRSLLIENGINSVVAAFDADVAGQAGNKRLGALLSDYFHFKMLTLPSKDPGDMTAEEIRKIF